MKQEEEFDGEEPLVGSPKGGIKHFFEKQRSHTVKKDKNESKMQKKADQQVSKGQRIKKVKNKDIIMKTNDDFGVALIDKPDYIDMARIAGGTNYIPGTNELEEAPQSKNYDDFGLEIS